MRWIITCLVLLLSLPGMAQLPLRVRKSTQGATNSGSTQAPSAGIVGGMQEPKLTPIAPNAAAMARYGDVQVNSNAGQINPSIPLYEIKLNDYTLPITLNYSSNGLKMNDVAGWVGMGWSINAMGTISRQVRSIPDEQTYGYNGQNSSGPVVERMTKQIYPGYMGLTEQQFKVGCAEYRIDSEPDMFYYNFGAYGGSFFFDYLQNGSATKKATTIPRNDLNIEARFDYNKPVIYNSSNKSGAITTFTVTDPQGVIYNFDKSDGQAWPALDDEYRYGINRYNTWYLHTITTPNGNVIEFIYAPPRKITHPAVFSQKAEIPLAVTSTIQTDPITSLVQRSQDEVIDYRLEQIKINDGKDGTIRFTEQSSDRSDWTFSNPDRYGNSKPRALDKITIENGVGTVIKEFGFAYAPSTNRLMLESVTERNGGVAMPPHVFSYFDKGNVPPYYSYDTQNFPEDYWGFFNECSPSCDKLIPAFVYQPQYWPIVVAITGENKQANLTKARTGQLSAIQYPSKGSTYFNYELNDYQDNTQNPNVCTGPYNEIGRANALMSNYSAQIGGVISESFIPIPAGTVSDRMCIEVSYSINIGGTGSQDEVVGAVTLYDASNVAIGPPVVLVTKPRQTTSVSNTIVLRGSQAASNGLRVVAELYAEYYTASINTNKAEIIVRLNDTSPSGSVLRTAGGLRIKQVKTCPTTSTVGCIVKEYQYIREDGKSSGQLITPIQHTYFINKVFQGSGEGTTAGTYVIQHQGISSSSQLAIANSGGNHIYYDQITIKEGGYNQAGAIAYNGSSTINYISLSNAPDYYYEAAAPITLYSPAVSQDWRRGKPVTTGVKAQSDLPLKSSANTYSVKDEYPNGLIALKTGIASYGLTYLDEYILTPYGLTTGFHYQATETSKEYYYDATNSPGSKTELSQTSTSSYDNPSNYFLTKSTTQNSKGETIESRLFYPEDLRNDSDLGTSAANALGSRRRSTLLKQETWTANRLTKTQKTYLNSGGLPSKTIQLNGSSTDGPYVEYVAYDTKGNLAEYSVNGGSHVSFLWGYNGAYPIVKALNATRTQLSQAIGDLNVAAQSTDNNQIAGYGESARSSPSLTGALVNSYTYKYGFGIEAEVDPKGLRTSYQYDPLGRLLTISNNNQKVVKEYTYNYSDGSTPVGGGNQPPSPSSTLSDQTITINQTFTYTLPGNVFTDPENQALTYTLNGLPTGLSFANGVITGTPITAGTSLVTLTATDPGGLSSSTSFFLTVSTCFSADPYIVKGTYSSGLPVSISAFNRIETDAVQAVLVNPNASLTLKASQSVRLKPGFVIKLGAAFRAYTGPCN